MNGQQDTRPRKFRFVYAESPTKRTHRRESPSAGKQNAGARAHPHFTCGGVAWFSFILVFWVLGAGGRLTKARRERVFIAKLIIISHLGQTERIHRTQIPAAVARRSFMGGTADREVIPARPVSCISSAVTTRGRGPRLRCPSPSRERR